MANPASAARSMERIERICRSVTDARALRLQLLAEIRSVVPFDHYVWLLTDPETSVGSSPLADVPCLPELHQLIRLKYLTGVNRWTQLTAPVAFLAQATDGDLSRSLVWRELLCRLHIRDVASMVFRDQFGCWAFLDLWRDELGLFTAAERAYLDRIEAPVTAALRRSQARTFVTNERPSGQPDGPADRLPGPVVLMLSGDLVVLAQTPQTRDYLSVLVPPDENNSPIPAGAYNVAGQLLAVEAGIDTNPPMARVHFSGGRWLTLRAARIGDQTPSHESDIAVTIQDSSPVERMELFSRAHRLTSRERELVTHLLAGSDTRDLARLMFLSQHTVQDHLKSIFEKTAVHNRPTLLARALGT